MIWILLARQQSDEWASSAQVAIRSERNRKCLLIFKALQRPSCLACIWTCSPSYTIFWNYPKDNTPKSHRWQLGASCCSKSDIAQTVSSSVEYKSYISMKKTAQERMFYHYPDLSETISFLQDCGETKHGVGLCASYLSA